ncbi:hypothetical protein ONA91_34330 [Micromonospora sp. DR5-3]|uniref:hypothetical protein n=1 Tax=unclassified Micromonospora TaxID=2617518 RepID=UPI0011D31CC1|nr:MULTISPECIES: hypothetical protein [unclassified Micromonospora]MCW3819530.1 hypothetical protein [Micromonospora sp. DR5-3]TYC12160.1 hypothetical protein FXF52_40270 [Micromonospora sp. MP36]
MTAAREEMACQICLAPLNTLGTPPTYVHPIQLTTDGHEPAPVPVSQLDTVHRTCDFCGDPYPTWTLLGGDVAAIAIGTAGGLVQNFGHAWAACATCQTYIDDGRNDKVIERAVQTLGLGNHPEARERIEELHLAFLNARVPGRTLITTTAWPATAITARELPKVRDRLARFYRGADNLPTALADTSARQQIAAGLDRSRLFWIDSDFTDLAEYAAEKLPDVTISRDLMPSTDGLLVWSRPVTRRQITAASWTTTSDGWHLVNYRTIGGGLDGKPLQRLREHVGWLAPMSTVQVHEQHLLPGDHSVAALLATWLLVVQQAAEITAADVDKAVRKTYVRTNRPAPEVRVVRIRANRGTTPSSARSAPGGSAPCQTSRFWVSGHWRNQPYGPGRTLRRPVYINPFLRGPDDAPIKLSTTVRMLSSRKPRLKDHE